MSKQARFLTFSFLLTNLWAAPVQWGENVSGVTTQFHSFGKEIALTFDACGGSAKGSQYDEQLIAFLERHRIKATLFINARWIKTNPEIFKALSSNPLFEIANHGTAHRPLSLNGKSVYGITGTSSAEEVREEIDANANLIERLIGKRPRFFRAGTAYYDEEAVAVARSQGVEIGGFSVLGDAGATFSAQKVAAQIKGAQSGDIVLLHMNHPESGTGEGVMEAVTALSEQGFTFVRLSDVADRLIRIP